MQSQRAPVEISPRSYMSGMCRPGTNDVEEDLEVVPEERTGGPTGEGHVRGQQNPARDLDILEAHKGGKNSFPWLLGRKFGDRKRRTTRARERWEDRADPKCTFFFCHSLALSVSLLHNSSARLGGRRHGDPTMTGSAVLQSWKNGYAKKLPPWQRQRVAAAMARQAACTGKANND